MLCPQIHRLRGEFRTVISKRRFRNYCQSMKASPICQLIDPKVQTPNLIRTCGLASLPIRSRRAVLGSRRFGIEESTRQSGLRGRHR